MIILNVLLIPKNKVLRHVWREFTGRWSSPILLGNDPDVVGGISATEPDILNADFFGLLSKFGYLCAVTGKSRQISWKGLFSCKYNLYKRQLDGLYVIPPSNICILILYGFKLELS